MAAAVLNIKPNLIVLNDEKIRALADQPQVVLAAPKTAPPKAALLSVKLADMLEWCDMVQQVIAGPTTNNKKLLAAIADQNGKLKTYMDKPNRFPNTKGEQKLRLELTELEWELASAQADAALAFEQTLNAEQLTLAPLCAKLTTAHRKEMHS